MRVGQMIGSVWITADGGRESGRITAERRSIRRTAWVGWLMLRLELRQVVLQAAAALLLAVAASAAIASSPSTIATWG